MYNPINSTNAIHTAYDGMKASSNNAAIAPQQVEKTNRRSEKTEAAKRKQKRKNVQTMNLKSGMRQGKNSIDIVA
jgi:hypothetical protein